MKPLVADRRRCGSQLVRMRKKKRFKEDVVSEM